MKPYLKKKKEIGLLEWLKVKVLSSSPSIGIKTKLDLSFKKKKTLARKAQLTFEEGT
jgi:hypothetical protein